MLIKILGGDSFPTWVKETLPSLMYQAVASWVGAPPTPSVMLFFFILLTKYITLSPMREAVTLLSTKPKRPPKVNKQKVT